MPNGKAPKKRQKKMPSKCKIEPLPQCKKLSYSMNLGPKPEPPVFKPRLPHADD